jgi:hypothetical protein
MGSQSMVQGLEAVQVQVARALALAVDVRSVEVSSRVVEPTRTKRAGSGLVQALLDSESLDGERGRPCRAEGCLRVERTTPANSAHNEGK